jgi:hypothetical protein
MRRLAIFFIATGVSIGVTAGSAVEVAAADQLSKKQFLKAANAICKKAFKAIDATFERQFAGLEEDEEPSAAQIEAGVAGLVGTLQGAATDIEELQGPAALEQEVNTFLGRFTAVVDQFEADPESAFAEELSGYPFAKPDKLARKIGLKECVQRG